MDSSFRTRQTATATRAPNSPNTPTNEVAATITSISTPTRKTSRPAVDARHEPCWCGQDMSLAHGRHCPRCGTMRSARVGSCVEALLAGIAA